MDPPTRRDLSFALGGLALGLLAGFLGARAVPPASPEPGASADLSDSTPAGLAPATSASPSDHAPAPLSAPTLASNPGLLAGAGPVDGTVFLRVAPSTVSVLVFDAEGDPVDGATVVATRRTDRAVATEEWPRSGTDESGRAELRLPVPGRWDIEACLGPHRATVSGIEASPRAPREVRLRFDPDAPVRVEVIGAPEGATWKVTLHEVRTGWSRECSWSGPSSEFLVPRGVALEVRYPTVSSPTPDSDRWWPDVREIVAPCVMRLERWGRERLGHCRVEVTVPADAPSHVIQMVSLAVHSQDRPLTTRSAPGAFGAFEVSAPPATVVSVQASAVRDWESDRTLVVAPPAGVTVTTRVALHRREDVVAARRATLEVVSTDGRPVRSELVNLWAPVGDEGEWTENIPADAAGVTAMVTVGAWQTSAPFELPVSGRTRVVVSPAGYVMVHTMHGADYRMGQMRIERVDGGWLGCRGDSGELPPPDHPDADGSASESCEAVHSGLLLGPLPAGEVPLRVTLGGVEVGRVTAKLKAGEVTVLSLR